MLLALAGCGTSEGHTWSGPPEPAEDGTVAVEDFAAHQDDVEELWEGSPTMAAGEFLRLDERTAVRTTVAATASGEGAGPQTVVVTLDGLLDDSVRAERWTLLFEPEDDVYRLASARWVQRCHEGRGHQDFAVEACV